jgi:membrane fusion protein, multidrug efflux system
VRAALKIGGIILALTLLAGIMGYLAGFFETKIPIDAVDLQPSALNESTVVVALTTEPLIEQAAGTVRAKVETVVSALITATISSLAVWSGDEVKEGDVLVELDARELRARVDQAHQLVLAAEARLVQTEKESERLQRIYQTDPGAVSKADLDRIQAQLTASRAELLRLRRQEDETKTALSYSILTAPIEGRIVERYADPGDTARQGEPLLRMYDPQTLRLEASVRESVASKLAKNQQLLVEIDAVNKQFAAVVDEIVPSADPGSRSFLVKVSLIGGSGLFPGMFGRLLIPIGEIERIYIPLQAVTHVGQLDFVMVKTQQGPIRRYVRLGARTPENQVAVVSGLAVGEQIVLVDR